MPRVELTVRLARESKAGEKDTILFDKGLPGFGLRIHPSGRKVWIVQARIEGRSRRMVIARYGEMLLTQARRRARDLLERIRAGANPAADILREKRTPTVREFADEYLRRCDPYWKPSGRKTVRIYLKARILPAFGSMPVDRVGPEDVSEWFDTASKDTPGAANRAFEILRSMMFRAEDWGFRERGTNPCLGIRKNPRRNIARFLDRDELARLGKASMLARPGGRRRDPATGAHRLPPQRSAQPALVRHPRERHRPARLQDRPARGAARRVRAGHRGCVAGSPTQGFVPVLQERRAAFPLQHRRVLALRSRRREARQASPPRPAPHGGKPRGHVRRESATRRQTARPPAARDHGGLRSSCRWAPCRGGREGRKHRCQFHGTLILHSLLWPFCSLGLHW